MPETLERLLAAARMLEHDGRDAQDIEFTIERGRLYFLQSRAAKLAPHAAAHIAVDLAREGFMTRGRRFCGSRLIRCASS